MIERRDDPAAGELAAVACPTRSLCVAVDNVGSGLVFNPSAADHAVRRSVDPGAQLSDLACPVTPQCTTVDKHREITFDPAAPNRAKPAVIGRSDISAMTVACPSMFQCTVGDFDGGELTFNPRSPVNQPWVTAGSDVIDSVACPSTSQCTTGDSFGHSATFNPRSPGNPNYIQITPAAIDGLSCPSVSQYTAVDDDGGETTFNPVSPHHATRVRILESGSGIYPSGISCPSLHSCTAVDDYGGEITFKPQSARRPPSRDHRPRTAPHRRD